MSNTLGQDLERLHLFCFYQTVYPAERRVITEYSVYGWCSTISLLDKDRVGLVEPLCKLGHQSLVRTLN